MDRETVVERVRDVARRVAGEHRVELVHVEIAGTKKDAVVRIFIDKEGGVTLDDCSTTSRDIEAVLDEEDFIPSRYVLEVSSPGIERELYSLNDFVRFTGELVKIKTKTAIDGQKTFVGNIAAVDGSTISIEERTKGALKLHHSDIAKANLKIDLSKEFRGR